MTTLSPHIYLVAAAAFRQMVRHGCSQSLVVSGESGAGACGVGVGVRGRVEAAEAESWTGGCGVGLGVRGMGASQRGQQARWVRGRWVGAGRGCRRASWKRSVRR